MSAMDFESIEKQALSLNARQRARLAQELLDSIDNLTPQELEALWLDEAERRAKEIDGSSTALVEGEEVSRKARALVR
jgi:hypothetical protein